MKKVCIELMKIAYLLSWNININDGVTKKVLQQVKTWERLGHTVEIFCVLLDNTGKSEVPPIKNCSIFKRNRLLFRMLNPKKLMQSLNNFRPNIVYLRHKIYEPYVKRVIKRYPTVVEMNTDDVEELRLLAQGSTGNRLKYYYHMVTRGEILGNAEGIIGVTEEIIASPNVSKYAKRYTIIPNSIDLSSFNILKKSPSNNEVPTLVFIGTPGQPWHGLDKIEELARNTRNKLFFHIIGTSGSNDVNIKYHGYLDQSQYNNILMSCDIGIGTLALHRNNMNEACPLKVREYLAYGLPVILGYKDTMKNNFNTNPEWILELENTEDNVASSINQIIEYAYKIKDIVVNRYELECIDINKLERQRLEFMKEIAE